MTSERVRGVSRVAPRARSVSTSLHCKPVELAEVYTTAHGMAKRGRKPIDPDAAFPSRVQVTLSPATFSRVADLARRLDVSVPAVLRRGVPRRARR